MKLLAPDPADNRLPRTSSFAHRPYLGKDASSQTRSCKEVCDGLQGLRARLAVHDAVVERHR